MDVQFEMAPRFVGDGTEETPWMGPGCCQVAQDVFGTFAEITRRGYVFSASCASTALGAAFTTTPPLALWNPPNSGRNISILKSALAITVVQTTINAVAYGITPGQTAAPTGGTALTAISGFGGGSTTGVGRPFGGSTLAVAPTLFSSAYVLATAATTPMVGSCVDRVDGMIVIPPGTVCAMQGIVGSGTGSAILTLTWVEIPLTAT